MSAIAIAELALVLLPKVTVGVMQFTQWLATIRASLNQTGEWSPEFEAQWIAGLTSHNLRPEEIPDAQLQ